MVDILLKRLALKPTRNYNAMGVNNHDVWYASYAIEVGGHSSIMVVDHHAPWN